MNYKLKSVKLWIAVTLFIAGTVFAYTMNPTAFREWAKFTMWLAGLYFAGNVLSKRGKPVNLNVKMDPNQSPESDEAFEIINEVVPPHEKCH